jgi:hypothetical protein
MLGHIFYFFGLILFLTNISILSKFQTIYRIKEWVIKFKKVTSKDPDKNEYKGKDYQYFTSYAGISVINFLWMFVGLIAGSWYVFLFTILASLVINLLTKSVGEFTIVGRILQLIKSIFICLIIGFLVINHFHLHWDIYKMITH